MLSVMKKNFLKQIAASAIAFLAITGCASQSLQAKMPDDPVLSDFGPAPELNNETWFNVDRALRLEDLQGKVVLLEMWTFG
jgi:hypothetical protein